jgi:hypothetical protein
MIRADEIFVKCTSREDVTSALSRIVQSRALVSCPKDVVPRTYMPAEGKRARAFYIASPVDGWVCVLESYGGDEGLARELAVHLSTITIWTSYSDTAEILEYSMFDIDGSVRESETIRPSNVTKKRVLTFAGFRNRRREDELIAKGEELFAKNRLPWPFYSFEQIDASPNKDDYFIRLNFVRPDE